MHSEYRILNVVVSIGVDNKPEILSDIASFRVDKKENINEFVGIYKQVNSKYPYIHELMEKKSIEVVILDDILYNGDLKQLLKKNKHMVMTDIDYKYKDYVYVVCKLDTDSYLIYTNRNNLEVVSYSDLVMYDEVGRLFNATLSTTVSRGKEIHKVICGTNINSVRKRTSDVEIREFKSGDMIFGKNGRFALDVVNLKTNPNITELVINEGLIEKFSLNSYDDNYKFVMPSSIKDLLSTGRNYKVIGNYDTLDLSNVHILNKNALLLKGEFKNVILSEDLSLSSNLDFLVYSLRQYTGDMDYRIENLVITNVTQPDVLDLVIKLLAELRFNTDYDSCNIESFPIQHIDFCSEVMDNMKKNNNNNYHKWINDGLTRFSVQLLENYTKAVGYYKKASYKAGKPVTSLSIQTLELLSEYEEALREEIKFFNLASALFFDINHIDTTVFTNLNNLIDKNVEERTNSRQIHKDDFIDNIIKDL